MNQQIPDGAFDAATQEINRWENLNVDAPKEKRGHFVHAYAQAATKEKDAEIYARNLERSKLNLTLCEIKAELALCSATDDEKPIVTIRRMSQQIADRNKEIERLKADYAALASCTGCICLHHNDKEREKVGCAICLTKERDTLKSQLAELREIAEALRYCLDESTSAIANCGCSQCLKYKDALTRYTSFIERNK